MAFHYPDLTPEQHAVPVEVGHRFSKRDFYSRTIVRVARVLATGWCFVEGRHIYAGGECETRGWYTATELRARFRHLGV